MSQWKPQEYFLCLIYQVCCNLVRKFEIMHDDFTRNKLRSSVGRDKAKLRIEGIMEFVYNMIYYYTIPVVTTVVKMIETERPAANPEYSPIPLVRRKAALEKMSVRELSIIYMDLVPGQEDQRILLTERILQLEGLIG
jgi:hypothetical protein